jgi:predicted DNA-binding transcriptional regulator AlpA
MANTEVINKGPTLSEIMLLEEVSDLTRIPKPTLRYYRHVGEGGPKSFKIGTRICYMRADVEEFIQQQYAKTGR